MGESTGAPPAHAIATSGSTGVPVVKAFFDETTNTVSYVVSDPHSDIAAIIDSVLDYDPASGRTSTASADQLLAWVEEQHLDVQFILETHVHADHLSAAAYLHDRTHAAVCIGANITSVQETFGQIFNAGVQFERDGSQFDRLLRDGDSFDIGDLRATAMHTPGHTPNCMVYVVGDAAFVGDTLFMPDYGTARCDFPGGDARALYRSIEKIFSLPANTRLFMCHDYKANGRDSYAWESTVAIEREHNIHVGGGVSEDEFVAMRNARDATLAMPQLILPAVQVNMRAGHLPEPEDNGVSYLKIPVHPL